MNLNPIDISFLVVMGYGIYKGITQGFSSSIAAFAKVFVSIFIALRFSGILTKILERLFKVPGEIAPLAGFIMVFVFVLGTFYVLGILMELFVDKRKVASLSQGLGFMFWIFLLSFVYSFFLNLGYKSNLIPSNIEHASMVSGTVEGISNVLFCKLESFWPALERLGDASKNSFTYLSDYLLGNCAE